MMTFVVFDYVVTAQRKISFRVPANVPGPSMSCVATIMGIVHPGTLYAITAFGGPIPANRIMTFACPKKVPLGNAHFIVLITSATPQEQIYQLPSKSKSRLKRKT